MYVLDASVIIKWFVQEPDSAAARSLFRQLRDGNIRVAAPDILLYELPNILLRKTGMDTAEVRRAVALLLETDIDIIPLEPPLAFEAIDVAGETGASLYDASYLALAAREGAILVTADTALLRLAGQLADVRLLSDSSKSGHEHGG
jgi:predicted nucleic acid-binding protein